MENNTIIANPQQLQFTSECIKGTYHLTGTTYTNICDGTKTYVANGAIDYLFLGVMFAVTLMAALLVIGIVVEMFRQ